MDMSDVMALLIGPALSKLLCLLSPLSHKTSSDLSLSAIYTRCIVDDFHDNFCFNPYFNILYTYMPSRFCIFTKYNVLTMILCNKVNFRPNVDEMPSEGAASVGKLQ